ncbi:right-handed parallel beta-helix repeat-containing protein [Methanobacterium sp.]|uniref:right-handed parallel beta-helix repeat-containing protein n=1 Tax=Methanobacterium sp. TaxID=2164 RepID=UPI0025EDAF4D|nr:right-handed parallel beta-helix repeat-containing protein [Methanobacterium sp.]MBI5460142.1 right-handed parallel beta-helix repeat-containing protein [Methanobacterium sp.]
MKKLLISIVLVTFVFVLGIGCVSATSNFTNGDIASASVTVKNQIEANNALPSSVVIKGQTVNTAQYLHLAVQATDHINSNTNTSIYLESDTAPSYQEEELNTGSMSKADYVDFAQRIDGYMDDNDQAPPYGWAGPGKISYSSQVYLFSRVLTIYNCSGTLPTQITMKSWSTGNIPITESQSFNFTPTQIVATANTLKAKIESTKNVPSTVTVAGVNINTAQFLHLAVQATNQIKNNNNTRIVLSSDSIPGSQQEQLNSGSISKADYIDFALRVDDYMDNNHQAPPYGLINLGQIGYSSEVYLFSRILSVYYTYGYLPAYIRVKPWSAANIPIVFNSTTFTPAQIVAASVQLKNSIEYNKTMPNTVTIGSARVNMAQYLQLAVLATNQINNNDITPIPLLDDTPPSSQQESLNSGTLTKSGYIDFAQRINTYIISNNNQAPSYGLIGLGTMSYNNMIYTFSKILDTYNSLHTLPASVDVQPWAYIINPIWNNRTNERFSTMQAAINAINTLNGDTLLVGGVSYTENVVVNKQLSLISAYGKNVTVRPMNSSLPVFVIFSSKSTIQGFNIKGSTNYGILLYEVNSCNITGNSITNSSGGIYVYYSNSTRITGNNVTNNTANGIFSYYSNNNLISGNNIKNGLNGIYTDHSNNNTISGNAISNSFKGIRIDNSNNSNIIGNTATYNIQTGIFLNNSTCTIRSNNIKNNGQNGTVYGGIIVGYSNNTIISGNNVTNNTENGILIYNSNNNTLSGNNVTNNIEGINLQNAMNNTLSTNNATNNIRDGIVFLYSNNNLISGNNITKNLNAGIYIGNSDNVGITENTITNNHIGICLYFSPATVNFNRIAGNDLFGLFNEYSSFVNATNNWWGTNTPTASSSNSSDIYILGGNVIYSPWIVLTVNSVRVADGVSNITADLTYNNEGINTLSLGHVPNGITVNFTTNYGTIQPTARTINGKTTSQLNYSPPHNTANVTVTVDNQIIKKTVNLFKVYNAVTREGFTTIQAAINDSSTTDGDIIEVANGTYLENIIINKRLTLKAITGGTVTVQALNSNLPVFTITSSGNGSTISGFVIKGSTNNTGVLINNSCNNTITGNSITGNYKGINGITSSNNLIQNNDVYSTYSGISLSGSNSNNKIQNNNIANGNYGIYLIYSNNATITGNSITGSIYGINPQYSTANIHFNRITGNSRFSLVVQGNSTINATNNWWGTNTPSYIYSPNWVSTYYDIYSCNSTTYYNPWLLLSINSSTTNSSENKCITADLTCNNNGENTSSKGHIPDNIPVNFTTNLGTIASPVYTKNGKTVVTLNSVSSGIVSITTTLDRQSLHLNVTVDTIVPTVNATRDSGLYNTTQSANLTASDNFDPHPIIYYTTNGSTPTLSSTIYTAPIVITTTTTLKFMAVDFTGNQSPVSILYYIFAPVGNLNTGKGYSSIQNAINNNLTLNGHVIVVRNGTYTENILVNKNLTIMPYDGNVTIHAANSNNPVITINSGGSESVISGFTLTGANGTSSSGIYLNQTSNCTIAGNTLTNNYYGLLLTSSQDNMIWDNNLTGNLMGGIRLNSSNNNTVYSNAITNNSGQGIYLANSVNTLIMANTIQNNLMNGIELTSSNNSTVYENTITSNHQSGIKATSSSADINFNIITGNSVYGLYNLGTGTVNATNNWWGNNNLTVSSANGSAIYIAGGNVTRNLWLVMNLTGSVIHVTHNTNSSSEITADITHNNQGEDTSSSGTIPDGLPVNFTTTLGTISSSTASTRRGKATVTLTSSPTSSATTIAATQGNYSLSKLFHKSFSTIQGAVNNPLTVNGDIILVSNGTYLENVVINKNLTMISEGNVTVQASNPSSSVFTVNNCGGVMIYGFTLIGATNSSAVYLNAVNNCQILSNTITGNGVQLVNVTSAFGYGIFLNSANNCTISGNILQNNLGGIDLEYSNNTLVSGNNVTGSTFRGVYLYQANNTTITESSLASNDCGILSSYSNNLKVTGNDIKNNTYQGIYLYYSSGDLHFNRILGNGQYGLLSRGGTVNATNNWWGTNNPVVSSVQPSAIYVISGSVLYNPRLVLTITPTSYKVADGKIYEATITADLNHNSNNEDLSTVNYTPDGIPVTFTSNNNSTITSTSYTEDGKASATLVLNPNLQSGFTNVTATLDSQNASTSVDRVAKATIVVYSLTALDVNNPTQNLGLIYDVPLNESVSWVSVLWKSTSSDFGSFENEVDLIVNGVVVRSQTVINPYYYYNKNNYSDKVWYNVNFLNWLFSESTESRTALQSYIERYPELQSLTGSALEAGILNITQQINDFNSSEMNVIAHHNYFMDTITTYITYPGDAAKKISFEDPGTNQTTSINFPGNPICRESTMIYANGGYYHTYGDDPSNPTSILYKDAGYEGVRSFAIVTTEVTDDILRYWLNQKDKKDANGTLLYANGPMKAAYGTFLEALLVIKCHDIVADAAATKYNVNWTRTTPIVVSVCDDAAETYITGEMDHRMGMDVVGDEDNAKAFRYACSSAFSPIEYWVGQVLFPSFNSTGDLNGSVTMGLGNMLLNGEALEIIESNGYIIIKALGDNQKILIMNPETGLVMDVMMPSNETFSGSFCYSNLQTEWATDLAECILNIGQTGFGQIILDVLNGGTVSIFNQFNTNVQNGLTGFINSAIISLTPIGIVNYGASVLNQFLGVEMVALTMVNAYGTHKDGSPYVYYHEDITSNKALYGYIYGFDNLEYNWYNCDVSRKGHPLDIIIVQHAVTYYDYSENKYKTETQQWVMLPAPLAFFTEGNSHTFTENLPGLNSRSIIVDTQVQAVCIPIYDLPGIVNYLRSMINV